MNYRAKYSGFLPLAILCFMAAALSCAKAQVTVDVSGGNFNPIPIAVTDFVATDDMGQKISSVISADLERSGLFKPLDKATFLENITNPDVPPRFNDWQQIHAQGLVTGRVTREADGRLRVEFRLWDIYGSTQMEGRQFYAPVDSWRRISHIISDAIYQKMTGEKGYFDTRIVFVDETGPKTARVKRLAIMDQDGANLSYLTDGREMALTPRFSPTRQEIVYMAFTGAGPGNEAPRVYLQQIEDGKRELVGRFPNMTIAPRFSPNGQKVLMSLLEDNGGSNIYTMDLTTHQTAKLTDGGAISTGGSYSPDGSKIVFESDRDGKQEIYVMNADGSDQKRISFGDGSYSTPVWSPRGDYIAFTKLTDKQFAIGVMRPDGSGERILTSGFHNEGPTWAPNGRVIIFFSNNPGEGPKLYSIDITGRNQRVVPTPHDASDPAWSPLLD